VTAEQLDLFAVNGNGNGHRRTAAETGLNRDIGAHPGAERLLRELVRRGLADEALVPAAELVLALEVYATVTPGGTVLEPAA